MAYTHSIPIRVRYSETDKMGFVYYGNYCQYYEIGRVEALRNLGVEYKSLEDDHNIILPVVNMNVRYLRAAYYDDLLECTTSIVSLPDTFIKFETLIYNSRNELLNQANITLCFVDKNTVKKIQTPEFILQKLIPYFEGTQTK